MVDEERYCIDVLTQIGAIQAALDKVALGLTTTTPATAVVDAGRASGSRGRRADGGRSAAFVAR